MCMCVIDVCVTPANIACAAAPAPAPGGVKSVEGYQMPPQEIVDLIDAPVQPLLSFSPDRSQVPRSPARTWWCAFCTVRDFLAPCQPHIALAKRRTSDMISVLNRS